MPRYRTTCEICEAYPAQYALQYIEGDIPQFYFIGWHIRGFDHTKVCPDCMMKIKVDYEVDTHQITNLKGCIL